MLYIMLIITLIIILLMICLLQTWIFDNYDYIQRRGNSIWELNFLRATLRCCEYPIRSQRGIREALYGIKIFQRKFINDFTSSNRCYLMNDDVCLSLSAKDEIYHVINHPLKPCPWICTPLTIMTRIFYIVVQFVNICIESIYAY